MKEPCDRYGVTHEIKSPECDDVYIGETSRAAYTRGTEQLRSLDNKEELSALWKHSREKHENKIQCYSPLHPHG